MESIEPKNNPNQPEPSSAIRELVDTDSNLNLLEAAVCSLRRRKDAVQLELKKPGIAANKGPGVARAACCWSGAVSSRAGQCGRILGVLIAARGAWVPLPRIIECAAQYNARIFELRRLGFHITNRTREIDGQRHSWFRIEPTETIVSRCQHENAAPAATRCSFPEFGALGKEAGYPD